MAHLQQQEELGFITPTPTPPPSRQRYRRFSELVNAVAAETSDGGLMKLLETPLMSSPAPLAEQSTAAQPPPAVAADDDGCELFFSQSDITAMRDDCYVSLPPSPPVTPASLPFASCSWQLPTRLGVHASIQVLLALVVACVACLTELYTNPVRRGNIGAH